MKTSCDVIGDLLPLYVEEIASPGSVKLVEDHLEECPACSRRLEAMRQPVQIPREQMSQQMLDVGKRIAQRTIVLLMAMILLVSTVVTWTFSVLTLRFVPVPMEDAYLGITRENGEVTVKLRVTGNLSWHDEWDYRYDTEVGEKIVCLSVNRRLWDVLFGKDFEEKIYEVPVRDAVSIWFLTGPEAECIYGDETAAPKIGPDPVFWFAVGSGALLLVLYWVTRWKWLRNVAWFMGNLLLADLCCSGGYWLESWYRDMGILLCFYGFMALLMTGCQSFCWALWRDRNQL